MDFAMKRKIAAIMLMLALAVGMPLRVFAIGWSYPGTYTYNNTVQFGFAPEDSVLVYNKDVQDWPDYSAVYAGSVLYVPIRYLDVYSGNEGHASSKQVKEYAVEVSYKATQGAQYIEDVTIVDGKKDKVKELGSGAYAKVQFSNIYTGTNYGYINLKLVLSVNKVGYQETEAELVANIKNWTQYISKNSVYPAQVATKFEVDSLYNGDVTFDMGSKIKYTVKVARNAKYVVNFDRTPNEDIAAMYPKVYTEVYNFMGESDTFASEGKLEIPVSKAKFKGSDGKFRVVAYEILDGKLQALDSRTASYDSKTGKLTILTQTLGNYLLSSEKLMQTVTGSNTQVLQSGYAAANAASQASSAVPR